MGSAADEAFIVALAPRFAEFPLPPWLDPQEVASGTAEQLRRALRMDHGGTVLIAEGDDGEALGFAWLVLVEDFYTGRSLAKISEIATARDGTGVGSALMRAAERWAQEHGCERMVLNVVDGNARARAFYERHGYASEYTMLVKPLPRKRGNRLLGG